MKRTPLFILATAVTALLASACGMFEDSYQSYALVYGANEVLAGSTTDAENMTIALQASGYTVTMRKDNYATKAQFTADVANLAADAQHSDTVVVYFSGHGGFGSLTPSGLEVGAANAEDEYIIFNTGAGPSGAEATYLSDDAMNTLLNTIPASKRILILDTCYSGGFVGGGAGADAIPANYPDGIADPVAMFGRASALYFGSITTGDVRPGQTLVMSAAGESDYSLEAAINGVSQGIFTRYLIESRTHADFDGNGVVSALEAYYYASYRTQRVDTGSYPAYSPHVGSGPVDFILFR